MAEGWGNHLYGDRYTFFSAGTKKHGLNPLAVQVMREAGVNISKHKSKTLDEISTQIDLVVTVCSDAEKNCPYLPGVKLIHCGFDDPPKLAKELEDKIEIHRVYARVRDEIKSMVESLPLKIAQEFK